MALPIVAAAGLISWLWRIGSILLSILAVLGPILGSWFAVNSLLKLAGDTIIPLLAESLPTSTMVSLDQLGNVVSLSVLNAILPLQEMIFIMKAFLSAYVGVIAAKITIALVGPLLKIGEKVGSLAGWATKMTALGNGGS